MLTGRDTVPAIFAATAFRNGWTDLARRVRLVALGLGEPGTVACPTSDAGALAVLAAGGAIDFDAPPQPLDEAALEEAGRVVDERAPDEFERRWSAVAPGDVAAVGDAGARWTHGSLVWAARSFAQGIGAEDGTTLRLAEETEADGLDGVRRFVVRTLVPSLAGARLIGRGADVEIVAAEEVVLATRPLIASVPTGRWRGRGAAAAARAELGLDRARLVLVTGDSGVAVDWLLQLGVRAEPLAAVPGCASPISAARPLPGVTVAVADDGELLVRADAVALGRCEDGWLHTARYS